MTYEAECRAKRGQVEGLLRRIAKLDPVPDFELIPAAEPYHYRNRITLHGPGNPAFIGHDSGTRVEIRECLLAEKPLNGKLSKMVDRGRRIPERLTLRTDGYGRVYAGGDPTWEFLDERVGEHDFRVPPESFLQVNRRVAESMTSWLRKRVRGRALVDAYGGCGYFTLALGDLFERVDGIESDAVAVNAAEENIRAAGWKHAHFHLGKTRERLPRILKKAEPGQTCLLLDPPRAGLHEKAVEQLVATRPGQVVVVSCEAPVFARDVARLAEIGYRLNDLCVFDMFPRTAPMESVGIFVQ
jgi:tRNA/tmRNA/rRNA uracil-C5-methylase (TrmA/RlmC/RlmD family)